MRAFVVCFFVAALGSVSWAGFEGVTSLDWSPDPDFPKLLLAAGGRLYLGDAPTAAGAEVVSPEGAWVTWARFGPDGSWFVYVAPSEDGYVLWKGRGDGGEPEELYRSPTPIWQPDVAPDGRSAVFVGLGEDGQPDLFRLDLQTKELARLTRTPFQEACPDFSPDGKLVAFVGLWDTGGGSWDLFLLEVDTGSIQQLNSDRFFDWCPRFSPDGEWIAFESARSGLSDIYVLRRDGGDLTPFTYDEWRDAFPAWSPDGNQIAYAQRKPSGWVILAEGAY